MYSSLNKYRSLPPVKFDALLGKLLKGQAEKRRAALQKQRKKTAAKGKSS